MSYLNLKGMPELEASSLDKQQRRLLNRYQSLSEQDRQTLLRFAEFLGSKHESDKIALQSQIPEPMHETAPPDESVIAAIRRLSKTYFMVEKEDLLHETSGLMAEHVMQGKSAPDVIKKLEALFQHHYRLLKQGEPDLDMPKHS